MTAGCARHGSQDPATPERAGSTRRLLGPAQDGPPLALPSDRMRNHPPYPLAVGNAWGYRTTARVTLVTPEGPQAPQEFEHTLNVNIVGTTRIGAREYFIQSESDPLLGAPPEVFAVRQDRSGLFELDDVPPAGTSGITARVADRSGATAAALRDDVHDVLGSAPRQAAFQRAADEIVARVHALRHASSFVARPRRGGPEPGEISLLRYPLRVGARWIVRESPRFTRVVLARERVRVPAGSFNAWRLRGASELFGPADRVRFWYSGVGLLRLSAHLEADATDDSGHVVGRLLLDQEQVLDSFQLFDPDAPHKQAETPVAGTETE
jgi:hypothetical protein